MQVRGTENNPEVTDDKIAQVEFNAEEKKKQKQVLADHLAQWTAFKETPQGAACTALADPNISHLNYLLSLSLDEVRQAFPDITSDNGVQEKRAEWRGQKRVWYRIKYDEATLQKELAKLDPEGKEGKQEQTAWKPVSN